MCCCSSKPSNSLAILRAWARLSVKQAYDRVNEWFANHADKLRGGSKLKSPETATTVRLDGGEPVITDGPFVEGKEVVSGYVEIEVADLDEALQCQDLAGLPDRRDPPRRVRVHVTDVVHAQLGRVVGEHAGRLAASGGGGRDDRIEQPGRRTRPLSPLPRHQRRSASRTRPHDEAQAADRHALELTANPAERAVLEQRIDCPEEVHER